MKTYHISPEKISGIDLAAMDAAFLDEAGRMRCLPAAAYQAYTREHLYWWAKERARYGFPTIELIAFIKRLIDGRPAIEIGAGMGDIGRHLGIPMTDSYVQTRVEMRLVYKALRAEVTRPPKDVEKLSGMTAVLRKRPKVVVASWVTQLYKDGDTPRRAQDRFVGSCVEGVDELALLKHIDTYIFYGNLGAHSEKRILKEPHVMYQAPFMMSRTLSPEDNMIWVWGPHPQDFSLAMTGG